MSILHGRPVVMPIHRPSWATSTERLIGGVVGGSCSVSCPTPPGLMLIWARFVQTAVKRRKATSTLIMSMNGMRFMSMSTALRPPRPPPPPVKSPAMLRRLALHRLPVGDDEVHDLHGHLVDVVGEGL